MTRVVFLFLIIFCVTSVTDTFAQGRRRPKRSGKPRYYDSRIGNYRGQKVSFGRNKQYLSVGLNINASNYFGDLAPNAAATSFDFNFTRPSFGIFATQRLGPRFSARVAYNFIRIAGDDFESASSEPEDQANFPRFIRNLSFRNNIHDLSFTGHYDLIPNRGSYLTRLPVVPYIFAGISVFLNNPQAQLPFTTRDGNPLPATLGTPGEFVSLRELGTEGQFTENPQGEEYGAIQISVPLGVGVRVRVTDNINVSLELGYRLLFTDYIDDVGGNFADIENLPELAALFADRSTEVRAISSGAERQIPGVGTINDERFVQEGVLTGFSDAGAIRGNTANDGIFVTSIHIEYIIPFKGFGSAKFR